MAITAANIITRVQALLQDDTGIRWPEAELLLWISDAQREICLLKPDASAINDIVKLRANTTKQTMSGIQTSNSAVPTGNRFLRVIRNIHTTDYADNSGNGAGRSIRLVSRRVLDSQFPDWHDPSAANGTDAQFVDTGENIKHYIFDEIDPQTFYVFPGVKASANVFIEIIYSGVPADVAAKTDVIDLPDVFANCITDYVCYRAFSKEADYAANAQRAQSHYQQFLTVLGVKSQGDVGTSPNVTANFERGETGNPTITGAVAANAG
jgi:hypothetical protein|tara:strand:- start:7732 stop:8529 length:798 start_codon:yes stop_codon:yes gene_type:complete